MTDHPQHDTEARRWSTVMLVIFVVVFSIAIGIVWKQVSSLRGSVNRINTTVERIEQSSTRTEAAADELVAFVRELKAQPQTDRTAQAVQLFTDLLCASSDPVRREACAQLTGPGG